MDLLIGPLCDAQDVLCCHLRGVREDHAKGDDVAVTFECAGQGDEGPPQGQEAVDLPDLLAVAVEKVFHVHLADADRALVGVSPLSASASSPPISTKKDRIVGVEVFDGVLVPKLKKNPNQFGIGGTTLTTFITFTRRWSCSSQEIR